MSFELNNAQIRADMGQVDGELRRVLSLPRYSKPIRVALDYLIKSPGKRLRPLLTVLSYRSIAGDVALPKSVIRLATAIELIHMASLVHDDIIDAADTRHGQPSFHKQFGVEVAIPVGVLLYSISLKLLADVGQIEVISRVSRAVDQLCGGELDQVLSRNQFDISVADYLLVLKKKTSALFSLSVWGGVLLAGAAPKKGQDAFHFGTSLGLLFQVSDDLLDVIGRSDQLLKEANQDFILGEITLPMIVLLKRLSPQDRLKALGIMESRDWDGLQWLVMQLSDSGVREECSELMARYQARCEGYLGTLPRTEYSEILERVVGYISGRATG